MHGSHEHTLSHRTALIACMASCTPYHADCPLTILPCYRPCCKNFVHATSKKNRSISALHATRSNLLNAESNSPHAETCFAWKGLFSRFWRQENRRQFRYFHNRRLDGRKPESLEVGQLHVDVQLPLQLQASLDSLFRSWLLPLVLLDSTLSRFIPWGCGSDLFDTG